jgi:hypothetical protein
MAQQPALIPSKSLDLQIDFARHSYDNQQAIIRQLDAKAGVFITLLVFLATGTLSVAKDVSTKLHWSGSGAVTSWIYIGTGVLLVLAFLITAWSVQRVIRPRGSEHKSLSRGLMFAADILKHGDPERFHSEMEDVSEPALLKSLTGEIFQLSAIVQQKTAALRFARWPTMTCFAAWALNSIAAIYILTW